MELDEVDRRILRILMAEGRTPLSEIAREIDMASATVHDRVNRLEDNGIITGYHAHVDSERIGLGISAFVGLRVEQGRERETLDELAAIEGVQEVYLTTGQWDVMMRIYARDTGDLRETMFDTIAQMDGFARSQTMVILGTHYHSNELPLASRGNESP